MSHMKLVSLIILGNLSISCGSSSGKKSTDPAPTVPTRPISIPVTPPTSPTLDAEERVKYKPSWLSPEWESDTYFLSGGEFGNFGILPGEEDIADSMYRYWEGVRSNWNKDLKHGVIPEAYLTKVSDEIEWVDGTEGKIQGFEKLKAVLPEMKSRCPSLDQDMFRAPLRVLWGRENDSPNTGRMYATADVHLDFDQSENRKTIRSNTNLRPILVVRAEWPKRGPQGDLIGYEWPKQTFKEITGGKSYSDGAFTSYSVDETFAHEYGHFLMQAIALNTGRSKVQTQKFSEFFAEAFRTLCWGGSQDNPDWVPWNYKSDFGSNYENRMDTYLNSYGRFRNAEYAMYSFDSFLTHEAHFGRYDTDKIFKAMVETILSMKGRIVNDYPAIDPSNGDVLLSYAPWSAFDVYPLVKDDPAVMFTRQEFLDRFCDHYECDEKPKALMKAEAEGLKKYEW